MNTRRPNILYICSHDTGRYVQPYGHAIPTPTIQKLAEQGILFRQAFCAAPTCSASRAALLTGQCPHSSGMLGLAHLGFRLKDYRRHILHTLRAAGYYCALSGVQHVISRDQVDQIGYDRVLATSDHADWGAAGFLRSQPAQPFFLSVGFPETHRVKAAFSSTAPTDFGRCCLPPAPLPDCPQTRQDMADFKAAALRLDQKIATVLAALDESGLADNTLVLCTTDHGIAFPRMKCNLTDHGMGVMLILAGPGGFAGGKVFDAMVSHIDVFPTLCELLGIARPEWLEGRSLLPIINGRATEINEEVYGEVTYHSAYEPMRAVRTKRWKYIRRFDDRKTPVVSNCDDSVSKDLLLEHGWREQSVEKEQLYDLTFDPHECRNLADSPRTAAALADMRQRLDRWMRRTNDPLLEGPVMPPKGSRHADPDGLSNEPKIPDWTPLPGKGR